MAVVDNLARVAGTLLAIVKTRCELMAIELEEEWIRLLTYLLLSLTALLLGYLSYSRYCRHDGAFRRHNLCDLDRCPTQFQQKTETA